MHYFFLFIACIDALWFNAGLQNGPWEGEGGGGEGDRERERGRNLLTLIIRVGRQRKLRIK